MINVGKVEIGVPIQIDKVEIGVPIQIDKVEIGVPIRVDRVDVGLKAIPRLRLIEDGSLRLSTYGLRFLR
jgi:hypothetical protein